MRLDGKSWLQRKPNHSEIDMFSNSMLHHLTTFLNPPAGCPGVAIATKSANFGKKPTSYSAGQCPRPKSWRNPSQQHVPAQQNARLHTTAHSHLEKNFWTAPSTSHVELQREGRLQILSIQVFHRETGGKGRSWTFHGPKASPQLRIPSVEGLPWTSHDPFPTPWFSVKASCHEKQLIPKLATENKHSKLQHLNDAQRLTAAQRPAAAQRPTAAQRLTVSSRQKFHSMSARIKAAPETKNSENDNSLAKPGQTQRTHKYILPKVKQMFGDRMQAAIKL